MLAFFQLWTSIVLLSGLWMASMRFAVWLAGRPAHGTALQPNDWQSILLLSVLAMICQKGFVWVLRTFFWRVEVLGPNLTWQISLTVVSYGATSLILGATLISLNQGRMSRSFGIALATSLIEIGLQSIVLLLTRSFF